MKFCMSVERLSISVKNETNDEVLLLIEANDYSVSGNLTELAVAVNDMVAKTMKAEGEGLTPDDIKFFDGFDNLGNPRNPAPNN